MKLIVFLTACSYLSYSFANPEALYKQWWEAVNEDKSKRLGIFETDKCNEAIGLNDLSICTKNIEKIRLRYQVTCLDKQTINDHYFLSNRILSWKYYDQQGTVRTDGLGFLSIRINLRKNETSLVLKWGDVKKNLIS